MATSKTDPSILASLPKSASSVIEWWSHESVRSAFPTIAMFVLEIIAMLPSSSAEVENSFSKLGHVQTSDRLNMRDDTFESLVFLYTNGEFCLEGFGLSSDETLLLAKATARGFSDYAKKFQERGE